MSSIQERMDELLTHLDEGAILRAITRRNMRRAFPGAQQAADKAWSSEPAKAATSLIPSRTFRTLAKTSQAISGARSKLRQRFGTKKKLKPQASDQDLPGQDTA